MIRIAHNQVAAPRSSSEGFPEPTSLPRRAATHFASEPKPTNKGGNREQLLNNRKESIKSKPSPPAYPHHFAAGGDGTFYQASRS
jgi:hypothetical protein